MILYIYFFSSTEQILTLSAHLLNVHTSWQNDKEKISCSKKGKIPAGGKKTSSTETVNFSTKPILILSDKILSPMSKVKT